MPKKRTTSQQRAQHRELYHQLPKFVQRGDPPEDFATALSEAYRRICKANPNRIIRVGSSCDLELLDRLYDDVVEELDSSVFKKHCPPWYVSISRVNTGASRRNHLRWNWQKMASTDINGRTLYHPANRPKLELENGGKYVIGFGVHALVQLFDRIAKNDQLGTMHSLGVFNTTLDQHHIERDKVKGETGFWFWVDVMPGTYADNLLFIKSGSKSDKLKGFQMRIAFCPIEILGRFARVKTVLLPEMMVSGVNPALADVTKLSGDTEVIHRCFKEIEKIEGEMQMLRLRPSV